MYYQEAGRNDAIEAMGNEAMGDEEEWQLSLPPAASCFILNFALLKLLYPGTAGGSSM
jgi:hypothetical protein